MTFAMGGAPAPGRGSFLLCYNSIYCPTLVLFVSIYVYDKAQNSKEFENLGLANILWKIPDKLFGQPNILFSVEFSGAGLWQVFHEWQ